MSLTIYYSDKIEDLADNLREKLRNEREKSDPFAFSTVVVPNTNLARWLRIGKLGKYPSLCMGIEFPFVEDCLFKLLAGCFDGNRPQLLPMNAYSTGILSILLEDADPALAPFRRYIAGGDGGAFSIDSLEKARMAWQLSVKLADLMDKYEEYREEIVANWLEGGKAKDAGSVEAAEATLARKLFGQNGLYPPDGDRLSLRQLFDRVLEKCAGPSGDKRTIYFFGLSTLSPLQAKILHWLARKHDIFFYYNNVCLEYWGDIQTKREESIEARLRKVRRSEVDKDLYENPASDTGDAAPESSLLRQWGRAGRETLRLLVDLEEQDGTTMHELSSAAGVGTTMLEKVQASVRNRMDEVWKERQDQDASIQVVAAPGIRREVETVHNAILGAVWKPKGTPGDRPWGDCLFSDIAVLVPDMATYRPVIEAVFDGRGQIPYALVDTTASEDSAYLKGFLDLMALAREGLSRKTLFAVLDNPCVQRALSFGPDDVVEWRRCTKGIGAFDGFDGTKDFGNMSWDQALRRLRLGRVATGGDDLTVWEGGDGSALRFSEIVETLHRELSSLAGKTLRCANPPEKKDEEGGDPTWAGELRRIANEFLAVGHDDKLEGPVKGQVFATLSSLHVVKASQRLDFVVAAVEEFVGGVKCRRGSYLTKGVTIAGLQPMRPVPFKQVFILGMGEGMFPGRDSATTLEIFGAARTLGDVQPTAVKKHLLLETLMAVKDRLVLTYPCLDPVRDAALFQSGMVRELEKFLEEHVLKPRMEDGKEVPPKFGEVWIPLVERGEPDNFHHPDHPERDLVEDPVAPIKWTKSWYAGLVPTYSAVERRIAREVAAGGREPAGDGADPSTGRVPIDAKHLAKFLESPLRAVLQHYLGIGVEGYRDCAIAPDAPLELEKQGPSRRGFDEDLLNAVPDDGTTPDVKGVYARFANRGELPGELPEAGDFFEKYTIDKVSKNLEEKAAGLKALKAFVDGFRKAAGEKPDPVRTVAAADAAKSLPERLVTGQTKGWGVSGRLNSVLLFNKCGDERKVKRGKETIERTSFPPKAVLEPFATWMAMVAGAEDDDERSLRVGIADMGEILFNVWTWTTTRAKAKAWLDEVSAAYLHYLDAPDADGAYLDFGCPDLAAAFTKAHEKARAEKARAEKAQAEEAREKDAREKDGRRQKKAQEKKDEPAAAARWVPESDKDWKIVIASFPSGDYFGGGEKTFDNNLVLSSTLESLGRTPEGDDLGMVKDRYRTLLEAPMAGERTEWPAGAKE